MDALSGDLPAGDAHGAGTNAVPPGACVYPIHLLWDANKQAAACLVVRNTGKAMSR